ncbi:MAG: autotransporter-associated beta strand repeat-containing protein [Akkermansiaceae bacterium]|nr:autotransporter-associated beta strand repeat-containing protein [Verrucomicrobiales bacterium]
MVLISLLALHSSAADRNWSGTAGDNLWSTVGNWDTGAPGNGDGVVFSGSTSFVNTNNIANLSINGLGFVTSGYNLGGNPLTIVNGIFDSAGANTNRIILTLGASQTFTSAAGGLVLVGNITNGPFDLTLQADAEMTVSGIIGNGAGGVVKQGAGTLILSGANTFQGGLTLNDGQVNLGNANAVPNGAGAGNVFVAASATLDIADGNRTINGLNGSGTVQNTGAGIDTLTIGSNATNSAGTFTGTIQNGTGFLGLTKLNTNTFTLNGNSTFTGPTTISGGNFVLGAAGLLTGSSNIVVAPGAVLDVAASLFTLDVPQQLTAGRATNGGPADVVGSLASAGTITIRGAGTAGTLTLSSGLTLQGGTVVYDLRNNTAVGAGLNDLITLNGPLNLTSPTLIKPSFLDGTFAAGAYTLVNGITSIAGSTANLNVILPRGVNRTITTPAGSLQIAFSGTPSPGQLVWAGGIWDVGVSQAWLNGGVPDVFLNFDNVTFTDIGAGSVTVDGSVTAGSMIVSNDIAAYVFPGPGSIGGSGSLTKYGTNQLAFTGPGNTYSGPTIINGGELFLDFRTQLSVVPANNILYAGDVTNSLTLNGSSLLTVQSGGGIQHRQHFSNLIVGRGVNRTAGPARTANDTLLVFYGPIIRTNAGGVIYLNMVQRESGDDVGEWTSNLPGPIGGYAVWGIAPVTAWAARTLTNQVNVSGVTNGWIDDYAHTAGESGNNAFLTNTHNVTVTTGNSSTTKTNITINSLRFSEANRTVTLSGTNTISNGGILVSSLAGNATINGGTLVSGNGLDLILQQHNASAGQALAIASIIGNNGGATNLTKAGPGLVALSGANTYNGTTYILEGTLQLGNGGASGSIANMNAIVNQGTFAYKRSDNVTHSTPLSGTGGFATFGTGVLSFTATAAYSGPTTVGPGATLHVGNGGTAGNIGSSSAITVGSGGTVAFNRSDALVYSGTVSGAGSLSKLGAGTATLDGTLDYTGSTIVGAGTLSLGGSVTLANSPAIRVESGATLNLSAIGGATLAAGVSQTLSGNGSVSGNVTSGVGTRIAPGTGFGSLTFNNDLILNGGTVQIEISTATNDSFHVLGNLALNSGIFQLIIVGGTIANGTYPLFTATSLSGSLANMTVIGLPPTQDGVVISTGPGVYSLVVSATTAPTVVWRGDGSANLWDLNASLNWRSNGAPSVFLNNWFVSFDNTGSNNVPVSLVGTLLPKAVTVNASGNYIFGGSGKISSSATLDKAGSGTLTVATLNDNFGQTTISGGTLQVGNGSSSGAIGSTLLVNNAALVFNQPADYTNASTISGSGTLTKQDTNVLTLSGNNTYTNLTTAKGILTIGEGGPSGALAGPVKMLSDVVDLGGGIFQTNLASLIFNQSGNIGQTTVSGEGNLANHGSGTVTLTTSNSYIGDTILGNGISAGKIVQGAAGAIPGGPGFGNVVGAAGNPSLDLNGINAVINGLTGAGGFIGNDGGSGTVTLTIGANGASAGPYTGILRNTASGSGVLRVVKVGPGAQLLNGGSSFTGGLRVEDGEINLRGNNNAGGANANVIELVGGNLRTDNRNLSNPINLLTNSMWIMDGGATVMNGALQGSSTTTLILSNLANRPDIGAGFNGSTFSGTLKWADDATSGWRLNGGLGHTNITFDFGLGSGTFEPRNRGLVIHYGALLGGPNIIVGGPNAPDQINSPNIHSIGAKGIDTFFEGTIRDSTPGNASNPRLVALRKVGPGRLTLSGTLAYTAGTTVSNGVLVLTNLAAFPSVTVFTNTVNNGPAGPTNFALTLVAPGVLDVSAVTAGVTPGTATLGGTAVEQIIRGDGTIRGSLTTLGNTTVTPGFPIGTLTVTNAVSLGGATVMDLDRAASPNSDRLAANSIAYGGTLVVQNIGGTLAVGDTFTLFSAASRSGAFTSISLPTLGGGLAWATNLVASGTISVVSTLGPTLNFARVGGNLNFTWAGSFKLQAQTNALSVGLQTNWFDYPGGGTSPVSVPVAVGNPTVFFRLAPAP